MSKPALLFYCQHSLGMGHLMRALKLVRSLTEAFAVTFLNGGPVPAGIRLPEDVELVNLPALGMAADSSLISRTEGLTLASARDQRRTLILDTCRRLQPAILIIELFPFGRKKFANELLPLLKAVRRQPVRPQVFCSLRDIMVDGRRDQLRHDNRAAWLVNRYFDGVLIHADPAFVSLEESFKPTIKLQRPVLYTGFVGPSLAPDPGRGKDRRVIVSAGGGIVGAELFGAAIAAHKLLWQRLALPMTLVAGPFLPEADWQALRAQTTGLTGLTLHRTVTDLAFLLQQSSCSVSQCGYNTAMDIVAARVPALVVPFSEGTKDEQLNRARRLETLGIVRVMEPAQLNPEALAQEIERLLDFEPAVGVISMDGAAATTTILHARGQAGAAAALSREVA